MKSPDKKTKAITETKQEFVQFNIERVITQAVQEKVPLETMEKLLAIRRELKAEDAKREFDFAMANFQSSCPVIKKTKEGGKTNSGKVAYKYAPLGSIVEQVKSLLGDNGLSYAIKCHMEPAHVLVTCIVKHIAGYSEESSVQMPLATKTAIMSAPQQMAATLTFGKRYAFCNAFGIMTGEDDTDDDNPTKEVKTPPQEPQVAKTAYLESRSDAQNAKIYAMMKNLDTDKETMDKWMEKQYGCRLSQITKEQATTVIDLMMKKIKAKLPNTKFKQEEFPADTTLSVNDKGIKKIVKHNEVEADPDMPVTIEEVDEAFEKSDEAEGNAGRLMREAKEIQQNTPLKK